ncbi:MAG: hypothetical protein ORN56_09435, partial [Chitinophagales bacterium]|nr:hypothetical protein [Chitinophagales bacterium]
MRKLFLYIILCVLPFLSIAANKSAKAYFNEAARFYVAKDFGKAKAAVREGLWQYPEDKKLLALKKKLEN